MHNGNRYRIEIAPKPERRNIADANDRLEIAARKHPLVANADSVERGILAKPGERLRIHGAIRIDAELPHAIAMLRREAADEN